MALFFLQLRSTLLPPFPVRAPSLSPRQTLILALLETRGLAEWYQGDCMVCCLFTAIIADLSLPEGITLSYPVWMGGVSWGLLGLCSCGILIDLGLLGETV
jgi:hypothetical protein